MLTNTITTAATLRTRSESPFVLPTEPRVQGTTTHDATFMVITPSPMGGADVQAAKQDRPPRGVPR